jgi:hypothetical protein
MAPSSQCQQADLRAPTVYKLGSSCARSSATRLYSWRPGKQSSPRTPVAYKLGSPESAVVPLDCAPGYPDWQLGLRASTASRVGFPKLAAATMAPGSLHWQVDPRAPATLLLAALVLLCLQCCCTAHLEPMPGMWVPEFLLPKGLASPVLQQLLCPLEAHAPT